MRTFIVLCTTALCLFWFSGTHADTTYPTAPFPLSHPDQKSGETMGMISIPTIGLHDSIFAGIDQTIIDKGIAHWAGSASPGEIGNMILGAHRVFTRGKMRPGPFFLLDELEVGDTILLASKDGEAHTYFVTEKHVVHESDIPYVTKPAVDVKKALVTLFTCHPPGENGRRLVIRAIMK